MRRIVSILLMAAMLFTVRVEAPRAQGPVPLEIEQFLLSMNIPPAQIPGLYLSAVTAMAGSTTLANFFSKVPVPGGFGLGTAASQSIRITVLEQLIGGWSGFQQAVLQNLRVWHGSRPGRPTPPRSSPAWSATRATGAIGSCRSTKISVGHRPWAALPPRAAASCPSSS